MWIKSFSISSGILKELFRQQSVTPYCEFYGLQWSLLLREYPNYKLSLTVQSNDTIKEEKVHSQLPGQWRPFYMQIRLYDNQFSKL